jgi:hypothetical protein
MALSIDPTSRAQYFPAPAGKPENAPTGQAETGDAQPTGDKTEFSAEGLRKAGAKPSGQGETPPAGQDQKDTQALESLRQRDREVRAHEQAHVAAGGNLVRGAASFGYKAGPDGKLYAVSGEVSIDTSPVDGDPRATLRKMDQVRKAALAPAQPSGQDRAVASAAAGAQVNAQHELTQQQMEEAGGTGETSEQPVLIAASAPTGKPATAQAPKSKPDREEENGKTQAAAQRYEETQPAATPAKSVKYKPVNLWA